MLLCFGPFVFETDTLAFQELQRRTEWRWASNDRVGARPALQFVGPGEDAFSLSGWIAPGQIGQARSLQDLRDLADAGVAYPLVDGTGRVHGAFVLTNMDEGRSLFFADGSARRIEFRLELKHVDAASAAIGLFALAGL